MGDNVEFTCEGVGAFTVKLRRDVAPRHCEVITNLVTGKHYDGCCLYRAEPGFVVQGGLRLPNNTTRPNPFGTIPLEYSLPNKRGTVTMARWDNPDSGNGEFFVNLGDNRNLDRSGDKGWALGFSVWGEVVEGMDVVEAISKRPTRVEQGLKMLTQPIVITARMK